MPRSSPTPKVPDNPQRLLDAALMAFNEAGIQGASIQAICRAAGASIGSAYHHYGSKLGLAEALYVYGMDAHL
ncbi:MAG: TetR/AcrR family transcriptional regulator, partial [Xanthomonadales bacterium]|nr:TetR/AcrR family transcriptional regulator [Xanthomonadales bacterium]